MKVSTGIDLVEVGRIQGAVERFGDRFLERVFTREELAEARQKTPSLAARFAAKEAVSKALGTGIGPVGWREIEILLGSQREPILHLHGAAARMALQRGITTWSVSLSHTKDYAAAVVVGLACEDSSTQGG